MAGVPVGLGKSVRFANANEAMFALGIPEMAYPIPAGIIEMSNGLQIPVYLDLSYPVGHDTAMLMPPEFQVIQKLLIFSFFYNLPTKNSKNMEKISH